MVAKLVFLGSRNRQESIFFWHFWSTGIFLLALGTVKNDRAQTQLTSIDHSRYSTHYRFQTTQNSLSSHQHHFCAFGSVIRCVVAKLVFLGSQNRQKSLCFWHFRSTGIFRLPLVQSKMTGPKNNLLPSIILDTQLNTGSKPYRTVCHPPASILCNPFDDPMRGCKVGIFG